MKFRFIGDPRFDGEGPAKLTLKGITFDRLSFVDVDDADLARRLATNTHFERDPDEPVEDATADGRVADEKPAPKKRGQKAKA